MTDTWVVTGGIGSGKSTVRQALEDLGAVTIDADKVGHQILEPGGAAYDQVAGRWPEVVKDGRIDRSALAAIVFEDPQALSELEAITHPAIAATIAVRIAEAAEKTVVVEVSVPRDLLGVGWMRTIVADLPVEMRRERLRARGMEDGDIDRRMANQPTREGWKALGRWVVSTAGSRDEVVDRVSNLWATAIQRTR
jgi:dephospho-CoA kinase